MNWLELKIPPLIVALLCMGLIVLGRFQQWAIFRAPHQLDGWVVTPVAMGIVIALWALAAFRQANTTFNPHSPHRSSALVTTGIFQISRNPMYVGILLVLLGLVMHQGSLFGIFVVILFMVYINRFQIVPEERIMLDKFGVDYQEYKMRVRRWF